MKTNIKLKFLAIITLLIASINLNAQNALTANITNSTFNKDCKNGTIDLMINAGFPPYEVVWKRITANGTQIVQTTADVQGNNDGEDIQNVFAATYLVEVTDAICGIARETFKVKCSCSYDCTIEGLVTAPTCNEEGSITINMNCLETGHTPFTYKWNDGSTLKDRNNLAPGMYCLTVSDKNNCKFQDCFTVNMGTELQLALVDKQNVTTCGPGANGSGCNGSIDVAVINGNGGYQYQWSNGASTQDLTGLCQGLYYLTVTDNFDCKKTLKVNICCCSSTNNSGIEDCYGNQPNPPFLSVQGEAQGFPNPNILVDIAGGTGDYSCSWTGPNGYTAYSCLGIGDITEEGTYCITVTDGCDEVSKCFEIVDCDKYTLNVTANVLHTCDELTVGEVSLAITGGTPPYQVSWNNSQYTGATIKKLDAGQYCAYVRDANGCTDGPFCFNVGSQPGEVSFSTIPCAKTIICNGIAYNDVVEYDVSWDCNTRYRYCPLSGETLVDEFGWKETYVEFCNRWGVCQSGETVLLGVGQPVFQPRLKPDQNCEYGESCVNSYCIFNGQIVYDDAVTSYCPLITDFQTSNSCGDNCIAKVYCGNTFMKYTCTSFPCIFASNDPSDESVANINQRQLLENAISTTEFLNNYPAGTQKSNRNLSSSQQQGVGTKIKVHPNPTQGRLQIDCFSPQKGNLHYKVVNVLGEKIMIHSSTITKGLHNFKVDLSTYRSGIYFIQFTTPDNISQTFKIIKN